MKIIKIGIGISAILRHSSEARQSLLNSHNKRTIKHRFESVHPYVEDNNI